jgi:hypothetical protein
MQLVVLPGLGQYALAPLLAQEVGVAIMLIQMQLTLVCVAIQFFVLLSAQAWSASLRDMRMLLLAMTAGVCLIGTLLVHSQMWNDRYFSLSLVALGLLLLSRPTPVGVGGR